MSIYISCDLKMANNIYEIQSHSSKHPCCWCDVDSNNLSECGSLRSFGILKKRYAEFFANGSDLNFAKNFANVIHSPLIIMNNSMLILDVIPSMELHLHLELLIIFSKIFQSYGLAPKNG